MDWFDCKQKRIVKEVAVDKELINSLIKNSENKFKSQELMPLNDITSNSKLSLAYDSLRELIEALGINKGFKIYNHECYTAFLKEIIKDSFIGDEFDEVRKIRNNVNYYGEQLTFDDCNKLIKQIKLISDKIKNLLLK